MACGQGIERAVGLSRHPRLTWIAIAGVSLTLPAVGASSAPRSSLPCLLARLPEPPLQFDRFGFRQAHVECDRPVLVVLAVVDDRVVVEPRQQRQLVDRQR